MFQMAFYPFKKKITLIHNKKVSNDPLPIQKYFTDS